MKSNRLSRGLIAGLSAAVWLTTFVVPSGGILGGEAVVSAAAAEAKKVVLTREEAIQKIQDFGGIPQELKFEEASLSENSTPPTWTLSWKSPNSDVSRTTEKRSSLVIHMDARTGYLLSYQYLVRPAKNAPEAPRVAEAAARSKAEDFLSKVIPKEEWQKLSKPNEFGQHFENMYDSKKDFAYTFTRVENGIPFIENSYQVIVSGEGEILQLLRFWNDVPLPEAKNVLKLEEAKKLLAEKATPSLMVQDVLSLNTGLSFEDHEALHDSTRYKLVYLYEDRDPQYVDAHSGKALHRGGEEAREFSYKPLGSTVRKKEDIQRIDKEEAKKLALEWLKEVPGSYQLVKEESRAEGQDENKVSFWQFEYKPQQPANQIETVSIRVTDQGELLNYVVKKATDQKDTDQKAEEKVSYETAKERAISFMKKTFPDRLGEIYLDERYSPFVFGWLHNGIPSAQGKLRVHVNFQTGYVGTLEQVVLEPNLTELTNTAKVDLDAAKKLEQENMRPMLTYYLPMKLSFGEEQKPPILVYRYVGDRGLVDAVTGEWIILDKQSERLKKNQASAQQK
ncbi:DUF4901 domain-containing protein [Brevibacillus ruminantium]|uniref:DUF4901 domain-containing protein n=1 Tax=Brevibacillus ruminantium TaxID=2950604 RepID=A0ABY4WJ96_9BACL|nr:DUF4901 domain-containing protein [Brevibacillus ruminantium]USG66954.1 DUF4901 domain-containing protein [Brevibacillus ruminantium]